jgi:folate-binding protein YgfZ
MRALTQDEHLASMPAQIGDEFRALVSGCGVYRLDRGLISLTGADRVRWLNGMVTNNVRDLAVGHGVYAFLLNPQGKIQGDLYAFNRGESLLVSAERRQVEAILQIFDRYIIMDDVEVENVTGKFQVIGVAGAKSEGLLGAAGLQVSKLKPLHITDVEWNGAKVMLLRGDNPCAANYELLIPEENAERLWSALLQAGAQEAHDQALETLRVACGIPKFGEDIRQRDLPQETGQERALNFSKGCYIGQEIVERIRSRGAVHRVFTGFEIEATTPSPGFRIQEEGKDIAELTSIAKLAGGERILALGYGRREFMVPGKEFIAGETKLRVAALPFSGIFERLKGS